MLSEFGTEFPNAAIVSLFVTKCRSVSALFGRSGKVDIAAVVKDANGAVKVGKEGS